MSALPTYFADFLKEIRLTQNQINDLKTGHTTLRNRLKEDQDLSPIIVATFLQGSYRRATAIRPKDGSRSDVDVVVVTTLDKDETTPQDALERFRPFVKKHYPGKYHFQGRSIGIELSYVDLDLVVTSAPSEVNREALQSEAVQALESLEEASDWRLNAFWLPADRHGELGFYKRLQAAKSAEEWKTEPLWIPDRELEDWVQTHPLCQLQWTRDKNKSTNGHYVNVVKALKWWRKVNHPEPKHPKSYPLEHIIGHCCPDGIESVAEGVTRSLEAIRDDFSGYALLKMTPDLRDHGVDQNVLKRVEGSDFALFHGQVKDAAKVAREALDCEDTNESAKLWQKLFGSKFPGPSGGNGAGGKGGFSERNAPSVIPGGIFA